MFRCMYVSVCVYAYVSVCVSVFVCAYVSVSVCVCVSVLIVDGVGLGDNVGRKCE